MLRKFCTVPTDARFSDSINNYNFNSLGTHILYNCNDELLMGYGATMARASNHTTHEAWNNFLIVEEFLYADTSNKTPPTLSWEKILIPSESWHGLKLSEIFMVPCKSGLLQLFTFHLNYEFLSRLKGGFCFFTRGEILREFSFCG